MRATARRSRACWRRSRASERLIEAGGTRAELQAAAAPGRRATRSTARSWDLEAKRTGRPAWQLAGLAGAAAAAHRLHVSASARRSDGRGGGRGRRPAAAQVKLGGDGDVERVARGPRRGPGRAAHRRRQRGLDARRSSCRYGAPAPRLGVELIEQPLPAGDDGPLAGMATAGADLRRREPARTRADLAALGGATTASTSSSTRPAA